jgi:DNA mismatch repair ATPase MutL
MARGKNTNEDKPEENSDNINDSDDNFGLPEIEYQPLNRDKDELRQEDEVIEDKLNEEVRPVESVEENDIINDEEEVYEEKHEEHVFNHFEEKQSSAPKIIGILSVIAIIIVACWYLFIVKPKQEAALEKARQEQLARAEQARLQEEMRLAELKRQEEERIADSIANAVPKIGTIETLSERTGRYYVIVASDIDDDLIMDYAKKLSEKGISSKIIPPFGKGTFYRISVDNGETYSDAQSIADSLTSEYPGGAWVVRY